LAAPDSQLRTFAPPLQEVVAGQALIRSLPSLGHQRVQKRFRFWCDLDMPVGARREYFRPFWEKHIADLDRVWKWRYVERSLRIDGPYPHWARGEDGVEYGDDGDSRPVGRSLTSDMQDTGKVDYYFFADFIVPEQVELYERQDIEPLLGKNGVRAYRESDFAKDNWTVPVEEK
jgi:hypothetical protein